MFICIIQWYLLSPRKPKLPIEMEFGADDEPIAKELAAGDPAEWDPTKLLEHAEMMTRLKDKIYEKAKVNIDEAQKKDKQYYDRKHADPKVLYVFIYILDPSFDDLSCMHAFLSLHIRSSAQILWFC